MTTDTLGPRPERFCLSYEVAEHYKWVSKDYAVWHERALARAVELLEGATNIATAHVTHGTVYSELMDARAFLAEVKK